MPITVTEKLVSRSLTDEESLDIQYDVAGTDDESDALDALKAEAPATWGAFVRGRCSVEPQWVDEDAADGLWLGRAPYRYAGALPRRPLDVGESSYAFDTGGESQHVSQAIAHVASYAPAGETATDHEGAVNVVRDGGRVDVQGVDVGIRSWRWEETHVIADDAMTAEYIRILHELTGCVNDAPFIDAKGITYAAGEALFLGASGGQRGDGDWEITCRFAGSPNLTDQTVGTITGIAKKGWEYLWVEYEQVEDDTAVPPAMVMRPKAVHIEQVFQEGDFSQFAF